MEDSKEKASRINKWNEKYPEKCGTGLHKKKENFSQK